MEFKKKSAFTLKKLVEHWSFYVISHASIIFCNCAQTVLLTQAQLKRGYGHSKMLQSEMLFRKVSFWTENAVFLYTDNKNVTEVNTVNSDANMHPFLNKTEPKQALYLQSFEYKVV